MKMKAAIMLSVLLSFVIRPLAANADTAPGLVNTRATCPEREAFYLDYEKAYKNRILSNFTATDAPEGFSILFRVDKNGNPSDISVFSSSKSVRFDISAFEAFSTSFPIGAPPAGKTMDYYKDLLPARVDFKPKISVRKREMDSRIIVHGIPLDAAHKYPNAFTKKELENKDNQLLYSGKLPKFPYATIAGTSDDHMPINVIGNDLLGFFEGWSKYFKEHKSATRKELHQQRENLLMRFKMLKRENS